MIKFRAVKVPWQAMSSRWDKVVRVLLVFVGVAVIAQNVVLQRWNRILLANGGPGGTKLEPGIQLRGLAGVDPGGSLKQIDLPGREQKLVIITTAVACTSCRINEQGWFALTDQILKTSHGAVIWISSDSVSVAERHFRGSALPPGALVADPPYSTYRQLNLQAVPRTLVVGPHGIVERVWEGPLSASQWKEIHDFLGIRL